MRLKLLFLSLPILLGVNSGCVTIQNAATCSVAGVLDAGGICSHLTTPDTNDLTFKEFLDMIEAQPERTCVPVPGFNICAEDQSRGTAAKLPKRGAAIILSSQDFGTIATELATMCRQAGSGCSYATQEILEKLVRGVAQR